jgi:hypothetical protein
MSKYKDYETELFLCFLRCDGGKAPTPFGPLRGPVCNCWLYSLRIVRSSGPNCVGVFPHFYLRIEMGPVFRNKFTSCVSGTPGDGANQRPK